MTFYEAAIRILERAGEPLHANEITRIAIEEKLLSHVGKQPEATMASRLAAMARRGQDRRLLAVEPDVFGLNEWNVEASPEALEQSGQPIERDENEPALRDRERHPKVDKDNVRVAGRSDRRRRHEDAERRRKRRMGPVPEFVFELLGRVGIPVPLFELAAAVRERDLVPDDLGREALGKMLAAENERREEDGRRPLFVLYDGGLAGLSGGQGPSAEEPDYQALVEKAVAKLAADRKPSRPAAADAAAIPGGTVEELRQRATRQLRKRLNELDGAGLEAVTHAMLEGMGYRDIRVAKRHKDGSLFTTRRRMGLTEVRFAIRVLKGGGEVRREDIAELRKDMASHSSQMGVIVSPNDVTREGRNEASQVGAPLVTLLCADALADQMAARGVGVVERTITYVDFDESALRAVLRRKGGRAAEAERNESTAQERRERREQERKALRERREQARAERRRQREEAKAREEAGEKEDGTAESKEADASGAEERPREEGKAPRRSRGRGRRGGEREASAPEESSADIAPAEDRALEKTSEERAPAEDRALEKTAEERAPAEEQSAAEATPAEAPVKVETSEAARGKGPSEERIEEKAADAAPSETPESGRREAGPAAGQEAREASDAAPEGEAAAAEGSPQRRSSGEEG